jgi:F0F1-type ATP synthase assembly protein I
VDRVRARKRKLGVPPTYNDALNQAVTIVVAPLLFGLLGYVVDGATGTRPLFTVVLAAFGVVASTLWLYYQYLARSAAHDEGKPWTRRAR